MKVRRIELTHKTFKETKKNCHKNYASGNLSCLQRGHGERTKACVSNFHLIKSAEKHMYNFFYLSRLIKIIYLIQRILCGKIN